MSKKNIQIPVSRFSYQVITSRYGHPLHINRHSHKELCIYLQLSPVDNSLKFEEELTETLEITLPSTIGSAISRRNLTATGVLLHQLHIIRLYDFIYAQTIVEDSKKSAYAAMKAFYDAHNLSEDDFSFDSAYRGWQRHKARIAKNKGNFAKNVRRKTPDFVHQNIERLKATTNGQKIRQKAILDAIEKIKFQAPKLFSFDLTADIIAIYLYRELCQVSFQQIATRTKRSKSTTCYHHHNFQKKLQADPQLRKATIEVLKYLNNCNLNVLLGRRKAD